MFLNKNYTLNSVVFVALLSLILSGCDKTREVLGLKRNQPDEFTVLQTAPLTLPPNFNELPTPKPGAEPSQGSSARDKARQAVLSNPSSKTLDDSSTKSSGEEALLQKAGAEENIKDIRQQVDKEANVEEQKQDSFIKNIVPFNTGEKSGKVINPHEENERLNSEKTKE